MSTTLKMKIASIAIVATTAIALSAPIAGAQSVADLQAMINSLLTQIQQLQTQISAQGGATGGAMVSCSFTRDLTVGATGEDVKCLQQWLNGKGFTVSTSGAGASGSESTYFGSKTQSALAKFQAANGITPSVGYFGPKTRAAVTAMGGAVGTGTGTGTGTVTGGSVTVTLAPSQPAASLAPGGAARVPFTRVTFTAGAADAVITGVVVERTGLANDAAFAGIVLLDENGNQLGIEKTFNSDHKLTLTEPFTVRAGTSRTMTIAGNMLALASIGTYNGQIASLSVVGVNTAGSVGGTFPVTGASHTINSTLTIGSFVSPQVGSNPPDPQANNTKEVGTTGYVFSSVRFSAGSAEDVRLWKVRWNQSGSAAQGDLGNLMVWVNGTQSFPVTVSADGKYYTADLGGILIAKGDSVDIAIKGDIIGGSGRTIDFDLDRRTDIFVTGNTFGYGITPANGTDASGTDDSAFHLNTNPWYDASSATVSNGTIAVSKATTVSSQNIAENVANAPLGGFDVEVKGEPVSVSSMVFNFQITSTAGQVADLTNVTLVGPNGIVAGPVDGSGAAVFGTVTFTDTVTFPIGKGTYSLKGKIGTDFDNDQTIVASTTPSADWTTVRGQTTGNTLTPSPTSAVTANTMTVKSSALTVSVLGDPVAQTIVAGVQDFVFAKYSLDSTASGEDVRVTSIALQLTAATDNSQDSLTNCTLWNGATQLNTGSNLVNPADTTTNAVEHTFTLDNSVIVTKGTTVTLQLTCDLASGTTASYAWGIAAAPAINSTGVTSGQAISETINSGDGQAMAATAGGSLTVALDSSSPAYKIAAANTTDNTLAVLKLHATNEAISVTQLGLELNGTASNTATDLTKVTIWNGATKVGEIIFVTNFATATLSGVTVPKDGDLLLTLKGDFSAIGTSLVGTQGALIKVDYNADAGDTAGDATRGTGQSSGTAIYSTGSDTASNGVRVLKGYPQVARLSLGDTSALGGSTTREIARWSVKSNNNEVSIFKFTLRTATSSTPSGTSTTSVTNLKVFAYTDSGLSSPVSNFSAGGQLNATTAALPGVGTTDINVVFDHASGPAGSTSDYVTIPSGSTYYFKATADIALTGGPTSASVSTTLQGDTAYPDLSTLMATATGADDETGGNDDLVWSPNATTTSLTTHQDWTNGYQVPGLPADNLDAWGLTK